MILDWTCRQCGAHGTAIAKPGEELARVRASHFYVSRGNWRKQRKQNYCRGSELRYSERRAGKH